MNREKTFKRYSVLALPIMIILIIGAILLQGCGSDVPVDAPPDEQEESQSDDPSNAEDTEKDGQNDPKNKDENEPQIPDIDFQEVQPNELGEIMILMYHVIGDTEGEWERTRENFRKDLERLYRKDYRLVNLMDVVNGNIDVPAGKTPVVLTFDDATPGQFSYIEKNGEEIIDPDSAVGIILEMKEKYDDFTIGGTFYVNYMPVPFRDRDRYEEKIAHLDELGFEVGNHGYNHLNLRNISRDHAFEVAKEKIQEELALPQKYTENIIPDYHVQSLALAFGAWPEGEDLKEYVYRGEHEGISYEHEAVLNVGWHPMVSPFDKGFDPLDLPRVRADQKRMDQWLAYFENNPEKRYISDGSPHTISFPEGLEDQLSEEMEESGKMVNPY